jgi:hypothetical protein
MQFKDKVKYTEIVKKKSLYQEFVTAWFSFYESFMMIEPEFNKVEGTNLKKIITYLNRVTGDENKALELWKTILTAWHKMDDFHKKNTDIKYIYSNINRILQNVKTGSTKKVQYSEDFKRKIAKKIQS